MPRNDNDRRVFPDTVQSSYALAWVVLDHRGLEVIAHGGALDGQRAQFVLVPKEKLGIAVLSNLHQTPMNLALAFTLMELCLELPKPRDWDAIHKDALKARMADAQKRQRERLAKRKPDTKPRELAAFAGTYEHKSFGRVRIVHSRGSLSFEYRGDRTTMEHFHDDTFSVSDELPGDADVIFHTDKKGVTGVTITGNFGVTFTRRE